MKPVGQRKYEESGQTIDLRQKNKMNVNLSCSAVAC